MKGVISQTPVRIAFGGGGTDVEPYSSDYGGYVVNATINQYIQCFLNKRNDNLIKINSSFENKTRELNFYDLKKKKLPINDLMESIFYSLNLSFGVNLSINSKIPRRAGLGASSSLTTAILGGIFQLKGQNIVLDQIAEMAYHIEQDILKNEGGRQDQYAAVNGGFNSIEFKGQNNVKIESLKISDSFKKKIQQNLILYYTGSPHISGNLVKRQVEFYKRNQKKAKYYLDKLKEIAFNMTDTLQDEDFSLFGDLLTKDMMIKKKFNPLLSNDYLDSLNERLLDKGALGGRIVGGGGGGCMIWLVNPKRKDEILSILSKERGKIMNYKFEDQGLKFKELKK
jgi:D-glycero-alpha-D-manno-heptose-7-phosphate kinase